MEKGAMTSSSGVVGGGVVGGGASAPPPPGPLPSAPPSYEEAVGLSMGGPGVPMMMPAAAPQMPGAPPYPAVPMPMPAPYVAPAVQMPLPTMQQQQHQQHPQHVSMPTSHQPLPRERIASRDAIHSLGPNPIKMSCPSCHVDIKTTTISDHQPSAHVCCIVLCLLGCCLCSCLPYCVSAFLRVHHICPNCKAYIGTWKG